MPVADDVKIAEDVVIVHRDLVNLYGCTIGAGSAIGPFVEIQRGAVVGARCKISSHSFLCDGVVLEDEVFVGHGVMFTNDRWPRATTPEGARKGGDDWVLETTRVGRRASIGSGATVLPGVTIGAGALVAAGAVVTADVADFQIVAGNPARAIGDTRAREPGADRSRGAGDALLRNAS